MPLYPLETQKSLLPEEIPNAFASGKVVSYKFPYMKNLVVRRVKFNNTGTKFAITFNDRHIRIWPADQSDVKASFEFRNAHDRSVEDISWNPLHADRFASCSSDGFIKIWDTRSKKCLNSLKIDGDILVVEYSTDGKFISVGLRNDTVIILTNDLQQVESFKESDEVFDLTWSNGSDLLAISLGNGNVRLLNIIIEDDKISSIKTLNTLRGSRTAISCIEFDPMGRYLAVGSNEGIVGLWDIKEWICIQTFSKINHSVTSISFSHDGNFLAIASDINQPINIVWLDTNQYIHSILPKGEGKPFLDWHPLKFSLVYSGDSSCIKTLTK